MSYYEDVYLARLNAGGTTRQERILSQRKKSFDKFIEKSIYKINFSYNHTAFEGSLQPAKGDEENIYCHLLTNRDVSLPTGALLEITNNFGELQKWLVVFIDKDDTKGYRKHKVYLLDRTLIWWDKKKQRHEAPINLASAKDKGVTGSFKNVGGTAYSESDWTTHILMAYEETLEPECYCLIDGSPRAFSVMGFDCETVTGVQYVTLDITPVQNEEKQSTAPNPPSFWGGN